MQTYPNYTNTLDVARKMMAADGFKSLYRGLPSPALGFGLTFAVSFRFADLSLLIIISNHVTVRTDIVAGNF